MQILTYGTEMYIFVVDILEMSKCIFRCYVRMQYNNHRLGSQHGFSSGYRHGKKWYIMQ